MGRAADSAERRYSDCTLLHLRGMCCRDPSITAATFSAHCSAVKELLATLQSVSIHCTHVKGLGRNKKTATAHCSTCAGRAAEIPQSPLPHSQHIAVGELFASQQSAINHCIHITGLGRNKKTATAHCSTCAGRAAEIPQSPLPHSQHIAVGELFASQQSAINHCIHITGLGQNK